jgi:DNA primase
VSGHGLGAHHPRRRDRDVSLSSPNRVIWPELGITKHELAEYAIAVAEPFLRANGHRPVSLERFPDSVDGEASSRRTRHGVPRLRARGHVHVQQRAPAPQVVLDEAAAIVWAVQMNTVVFHPWASLAADTDNPVELRIDLDPQPGTDFADAAAVAPALREVLREAGLEPG